METPEDHISVYSLFLLNFQLFIYSERAHRLILLDLYCVHRNQKKLKTETETSISFYGSVTTLKEVVCNVEHYRKYSESSLHAQSGISLSALTF